MNITYAHTNIIAADWKKLSRFYEDVFGCTPAAPPRKFSGAWVAAGTGVANAELEGQHLRLPGVGPTGPTLEIFTYTASLPRAEPRANRIGFGHLAFLVDDVAALLERAIEHGGKAVGEVVTHDIEGRGRFTFAYATDPEGNILELQSWA